MDLNYLSYAQATNLVENASYVDLSHSIILKEISSNNKIIKGISILFLIAIFNYIFPYEKEIPINNQYRKKVLVNQVENFSLVNNNENIIYFIAVVILVLIYFYKTTK